MASKFLSSITKPTGAAGLAGFISSAVGNAVKQQVSNAVQGSGSSGGSSGSGVTGGSTAGTTGVQPSGTVSPSYTENINADAGLSSSQLAQIQGFRNQAKAGLITWDDANAAANAIRASAGGYTVDKQGNRTDMMPQVQYPPLEEFMAQYGADQYSAQTQARIQAAVQQAVNGYNQQIETTNRDSDELARQAYIAKMLGQKNLDQQLSAAGYTGGMADSQRIQAETAYQNNLKDIELQKAETIRQLQQAIQDARLAGDMQAAQELAAYLQSLQSQWLGYVQNQQQRQDSNYWNQQQMQNSNYWNQQNLSAQNTESAYSRALNLISQGFLPDDATLNAAGISKIEAQARLNQIKAQLTAETLKATAAVSGGSSRTRSSTAKASTVQGSDNGQPMQGGGSLPTVSTYGTPTFSELKRTVSGYAAGNNVEKALPYLDAYWNSLSAAQQREIQNVLATAGVQYAPS